MDDIIKQACRDLRKNMTESEKLLWEKIRSNKIWIKIYRQKAIFVKNEDSWFSRWIIADFYAPDNKLVIEIDWNIHKQKEIYELDREKEKLLENRWYTVIRFTNQEVKKNIDSVIAKIQTQSLPWIPTL